MPHPPRSILVLVFLISLYCALSASAGVVLGLIGSAWFVAAFEVVSLLASIVGLAIGLGKFRDAPALATLVVGGCVFVAAVLAEPTFMSRVLEGSSAHAQSIAGVNLRNWALSHIGAGAALMLLSALIVIVRKPAVTLPMLLRGALYGAPVAAAMVAAAIPQVRDWLISLPTVAIVGICITAFFVLGAFFSVSVHHVIGAFERAIPDGDAARSRDASGG